MGESFRVLLLGALAAALLVPAPASARQLLKAKTLACGGSGPQKGDITATESNGVLKIKVKGENLVPGQNATCGYTCGMVFTSGPVVACGTVSPSGRLTATVELPIATCFGFIPFFNTPTTGKCVASTIP